MSWPDWQKRHDEHRQPRRRVDYSRPGFVRPPDPEETDDPDNGETSERL